MKTFKKVLMLILTALPAVVTAAAVLFFLPDTVPAHFGAGGTVDRYGSKYEAFILPGIILLFSALYFVIRIIIKKASTDDNDRTAHNLAILDTVILLILVLFNALDALILLLMGSDPASIYNPESIAAIILSAVVGLVFILIGCLMPKTKRNSFIGMRLQFTMDTDEHWYIANRAGGVAMIVSGLITVAAGLITRSVAYVFCMVAALIVTLTVAIIYSYAKIKKEKK